MDKPSAGYRIDWHADGAIFTLARPEKLNAITLSMLNGLAACLDELEQRAGRWLVIVGEGERAFCAGTDLAESSAMAYDAVDAKNVLARSLLFRLSNLPMISVAAINGLAYGGGLEIAMACTLRIAAPHAVLSLPEVKLGVLPSYGGTQFLPALVGSARALDLMLTGRPVDAAEALAIGLISRIANTESPLLDQARGLAGEVTRHSQVAIDGIRRCVVAAGPVVTAAGLAVEHAQVQALMNSEDAKEGVLAFLERRAPIFRHR